MRLQGIGAGRGAGQGGGQGAGQGAGQGHDQCPDQGIGEVRADAIIRARPFKAKTELVERRLIPEALYDKIADKVMARPLPGTPPTPGAKPVPAQPKRS